MSDADKAAMIERDRRKREDELLLLLLLLLSRLETELIVVLRHGLVESVQTVIANTLARAVPTIADQMAQAHADAFRRFGLIYGDADLRRSAAGPQATIREIYQGQARDAAQEMARQVYKGLVNASNEPVPPDAKPQTARRWTEPRSIVRRAYGSIGYAKDNPYNVEFGVERCIVLASNVGMLAVAQQQGIAGGASIIGPGGQVRRALGIRHWSIVDERTTDICLDRHKLTLPWDDPYWTRGGVPPLHPRCRSVLIPVKPPYEVDTVLPTVPPSPGWGFNPLPMLIQDALRVA